MTVLGVVLTVFCSQVCSALLPVSGLYGDTVALPCDGSSYRHFPEEKKIVLWETADRRVLEFYSGQIHTYPGFENRAELSRERMRDGDFSLILHKVTFSDQDIYECRFVDDNSDRKFLGDVKLTVLGHEDNISLSWGDPLSVPLRTQQAVELWFRPEGGGSRRLCSVLDSTVTPDSSRLKVQDQVLKISSVRAEDGGTYTVQDSQGTPISTVHVTVGARSEVLTLQSGDSLTLPLHTAAPVKVLFDPAGSAQSPRVLLSSAGLPGPGYEQRVWVQDGSLTLRSLTPADQGSYTVRDLQGNTISTAIVTVTGGEMRRVSWLGIVLVITAIVAVLMGAALGAVVCQRRWKMREE
ncbi:polymeric immunoglobulin receptor-like [Lepisosteus oculatus]|uniref:polymeric immunoglobulin receptor-like n=1 Tax=Lepisosteus oculatus TaxID=7918 RepID=UPI0035F520F8